MSKIPERDKCRSRKAIGDHQKFLSRITKTLYYGKLLRTDTLSIPVTELAAELFSEAHRGRSLDVLHYDRAAIMSRNTCASPCSLVLALLYLERLRACNPDYLKKVAPSELFLISLMVSNKFLYDDGEGDEVFSDEWAASGGMSVGEVVKHEREFLNAIDWKVFVNESMFSKKLKSLETILAEKQGKKRGWFTYTELYNLLDYIDAYLLVQKLASIMAVFAIAYTASVLTIVASMLITSRVTECVQNASKDPTVLTHDLDQRLNRTIDATDVLKTGILLASIKVLPQTDVAPETISWDWWNNPAMQWLSEKSKVLETMEFPLKLDMNLHDRYLDMTMALSKEIELEEQMHKGTKMRIQEQMERSWHKEWTDSICKGFEGVKLLLYYFRGQVKS